MTEINAFIGMPSSPPTGSFYVTFLLEPIADQRTAHRPSNCILQAASARHKKFVWPLTSERLV